MQKQNENRIRGTVRWTIGAAALTALLVLTPSPAWSADRGQCARIEAPFEMTLPDGKTYEAGSLKLCLQQMFTPAAGMHEIVVNGKSLGLYTSRIGTSEEPVGGLPVVVFQRRGSGAYSLIGYAWPESGSMRTYMLGKIEPERRAAAKKKIQLFDWENIEVLTAAPSL